MCKEEMEKVNCLTEPDELYWHKLDDIFWSLDDEGVLRFKGTGRLENRLYTVPDYEGDWWDFEQDYDNYFSKNVKKIVIEQGITEVGYTLGSDFLHVETISIPESVKEIRINFVGLKTYEVDERNPYFSVTDGVLFDKKKQKLIRYPGGKRGHYAIPDGVVEIDVGAFLRFDEQCILFVPPSVKKIGAYAFSDMYPLHAYQTLVIPDSVKEIGEDAIKYINKVVYFGSAVYDDADQHAAGHLWDYKHHSVAGGIACDMGWKGAFFNEYYRNDMGQERERTKYMLCFEDNGTLSAGWEKDLFDDFCEKEIHRDQIDTIIFKDANIEIGVSAFAGFPALRNVIILSGVQKIGRWAFYGCPNLQNIQICCDVPEIGAQAFQGAGHLFYFGSAKSADNWGAKSLN